MGKPQRRKKVHTNIKDLKKKYRTRRRTKDLDQIHDDMKPKKVETLLHQKIDQDLPGDGQNYCIYCVRHFMDEKILIAHQKTKNHKKRVRLLKEKPYTQLEAEMAAGMGSYDRVEINKKLPINKTYERMDESENIKSKITDNVNLIEKLDLT